MPNKIYQHSEATIWFVPAAAAQAEDFALEMHNIGAGAGRQSAHWDRGTGAIPAVYAWRGFVQFATEPVLGETVDFYLKRSGSSASATVHPDNDDGTGEMAVSAIEKLSNLKYLGSIVVDETAVNVEMATGGTVYITARGGNIVMWNRTADALTNDVDENGFMLMPAPDELQD